MIQIPPTHCIELSPICTATSATTKAVDDMSFEVYAGEVFGYIGPNGAGKTTSMRILATLDEPTYGDAFVDGFSVVDDPDRVRRRLGFMPDYFGTYQNVNVAEYLDFFARVYGLRSYQRKRAIDFVMEFTMLDELADKPINGLSKGMKQRLCLGRTMIHDPAVLILDEPAAGLDPRARIELREMIGRLAEHRQDGAHQLAHPHRAGRDVPPRRHHRAGPAAGRGLGRGDQRQSRETRSEVRLRVLRDGERPAGLARARATTWPTWPTAQRPGDAHARRRPRGAGRAAPADRRGGLRRRRVRQQDQEPRGRVPARDGGPRAMTHDSARPPTTSTADVADRPPRPRRSGSALWQRDRSAAGGARRAGQPDPGEGNAAGAQEPAVRRHVSHRAGGVLDRQLRRRGDHRTADLLRRGRVRRC